MPGLSGWLKAFLWRPATSETERRREHLRAIASGVNVARPRPSATKKRSKR